MKTLDNALFTALIALAACNGPTTADDTGDEHHTGDTGETADDIALVGTWSDGFGGTHTITNTTWDEAGDGYTNAFAITQYDNDTHFAIAQNASTNGFNPDLYSRFDWASDGATGFYYCQSTFDAATEADALAATPADATDPSTTGCGGTFPWTHLTVPE